MKKKIIVILLIVTFVLASLTALAEIFDVGLSDIKKSADLEANYNALIENIEAQPLKAEKTSSFETMLAFLNENADETMKTEVLYNYFFLQKAYKLNQSELDYIADLISGGCDAYTILDLAYFWLDTNEDIELIEKMYAQKDFYGENKFWYESAFYSVTEYDNTLTDEEYDYFTNQGIDTETMYAADKLSRKRIYTTKEILNKMTGGQSLAEIAYEIESKSGEKAETAKMQKMQQKDLVEDKNVLKSMELARLSGDYENMLAKMPEEKLDETIEKTEDAVKKSILKLMKDEKYMINDPDRKNEKAFKEKINAKGVSDSDIEKYVDEGYKYVDILNAAEVSAKKGISLDEAIKEVTVSE